MSPGPDGPHSEQVNARISDELLQALDARAAAEGRTRSQMIRRLIESGLDSSAVLGTISLYKMGSDPITTVTIGNEPEHRFGVGEHVNWVVFKRGDPSAEETR